MNDTVKSLYQQIKNNTINKEEAVKRMSKIFSSSPKVEILQELQQILVDLLSLETTLISEDAEWLELGLDQVLLKQLTERLFQQYRIELTPAQIMAKGTLKELAEYISQHVDKIQSSPNLKSKTDQLELIALDYLKKRLSAVLEIPVDRLDSNAPIENYGIDSVMIMKLTRKLEEHFGPLSKTLFFEYQTIRELANYLVNSHSQILAKLYGIEENSAVRQDDLQPSLFSKKRKEPKNDKSETVSSEQKDGIAIIGLAGRYPGANNIAQFWENLEEGIDSITEISQIDGIINCILMRTSINRVKSTVNGVDLSRE
ncbi:phosphopantetheine-binding protein [Gracilibacillus sp. JCM 18860]|uniref:phosphopantetheine-binding protein n=1 Tax=Gracilibacillus sp. JCM 18860 TaxID=1306159 RepID=UPI0006D1D13E